MNVEVSAAELAEKSVVSNLLQLYLHDFSVFDGKFVRMGGFNIGVCRNIGRIPAAFPS